MQKPCNMPLISSLYAPNISFYGHARWLKTISEHFDHKSCQNDFKPKNLKFFIPFLRELTVQWGSRIRKILRTSHLTTPCCRAYSFNPVTWQQFPPLFARPGHIFSFLASPWEARSQAISPPPPPSSFLPELRRGGREAGGRWVATRSPKVHISSGSVGKIALCFVTSLLNQIWHYVWSYEKV